MSDADFQFDDKKAEPSGGGKETKGVLESSQLDVDEKRRRGRFAETNQNTARIMFWVAIVFFVVVSVPYLAVLYLAVLGFSFPDFLDSSASLKRIVRTLDFPIYILALPFAVSVAFAFLAGFQSGMRGKGTIGPVGLDAGADGG